jgi:hypothetical protein
MSPNSEIKKALDPCWAICAFCEQSCQQSATASSWVALKVQPRLHFVGEVVRSGQWSMWSVSCMRLGRWTLWFVRQRARFADGHRHYLCTVALCELYFISSHLRWLRHPSLEISDKCIYSIAIITSTSHKMHMHSLEQTAFKSGRKMQHACGRYKKCTKCMLKVYYILLKWVENITFRFYC